MNVGIVGLGLIGGSMAKSIKSRTGHTVYGTDLSAETTSSTPLGSDITNWPSPWPAPLCSPMPTLTPAEILVADIPTIPSLKPGRSLVEMVCPAYGRNRRYAMETWRSWASLTPEDWSM